MLLKPLARALADGDQIWGVICGSAINHGGRSGAYTVPAADAQAAVISRALARSGIDPTTIGYIEAHGTGTTLGDPIEVAGLAAAFGGGAAGTVALGSVKSNIGHLESAAGIAAPSRPVCTALRSIQTSILPQPHSAWRKPSCRGNRLRRACGCVPGLAVLGLAAPMRIW